jgi:hypothetical protein
MFVRNEITKKIRNTRPTMARLRCMADPPAVAKIGHAEGTIPGKEAVR